MFENCSLIHHQLCPLSRQVRILLSEAKLNYNLKREDYWLSRPEFVQISPIRVLPILKMEGDLKLIGPYAIIEFLQENIENFHLMPKDFAARGAMRHIISWFNEKFLREVSKIIVDEKIIRPITKNGEPRGEYLRLAKNNLKQHFKLLENILHNSSYLVEEQLSCADITVAAHISIIDYFGEIYWNNWPYIKHWYSIIKSRPSMRLVLDDKIPGITPPHYYTNPDF